MDFGQIGRNVGHFVNRNSTTILSSVAVVGTISTAILAGKAAYEQGIDGEVYGYPTDWKDSLQKNWKRYIPAAGVGVLTIGCIVGSNKIGMRKTAALATVATMSERALVEYQDKIREHFGEKKAEEVKDEIAKERLAKTPVSEAVIIGSGDHLCFESLTGRYFRSDIEKIRRLQNDVNEMILHGQDTVSMNDWFSSLGLPHVENGDAIGWNDENLMEIKIGSHLADNGVPCVYIGYDNLPSGGFWKASR